MLGRRQSDRAQFRLLILLAILVTASSGLASFIGLKALSALSAFEESMTEIGRAARLQSKLIPRRDREEDY